jgi:hypothetical protein
LADRLIAFGDALVQSDWYRQIGFEYGVGPAAGSLHLIGPAIPPGTPAVDRPAAERYVQQVLDATRSAIVADGRSIFLLYLPGGVDGVENIGCGGGSTGHHASFGSLGDAIGVIQRCPGTTGTLLDLTTDLASHEVAEAVTDTSDGFRLPRAPGPPWKSSPWATYNGARNEYQPNIENADLCNGTRIREGAFLYQRSYSIAQAALGSDPCVPALPIPYYSVSTDDDWFVASPGQTTTIPLTGWSSAPAEPWVVSTALLAGPGEALGFSARIVSDTETQVRGVSHPTVQNAGTASLQIVIPATAPSGAWATFYVNSFRFDGNGQRPPPGEDVVHRWLVGVHVP